MRKILFRGKRTDNGEWVEGYYCRTFRWTGDKEPVPAIQENDSFMFRAIDPETIGQYTGLTDKNGKRIFEGDIVKVPYIDPIFKEMWSDASSETAIVKFDDAIFYVEYIDAGYKFTVNSARLNMEVVGNIHDNPELLKGENNNG